MSLRGLKHKMVVYRDQHQQQQQDCLLFIEIGGLKQFDSLLEVLAIEILLYFKSELQNIPLLQFIDSTDFTDRVIDEQSNEWSVWLEGELIRPSK